MSYDKKYVEFYNGHKMPIIGLGTWQSTPDQVKAAVRTALEAGYRHIDTAVVYANEKAIGDVLQEVFQEGKIKREDLFIVTKLPPNGLRPEHVKHFLQRSLTNLQLDYVDLYLVHTTFAFQYVKDEDVYPKDSEGNFLFDFSTDLVAVWKKMEEMADLGLAKSIGVSNFSVEQLGRIIKSCRIKPANNQVECHAYFQQRELFDFCKANDVTLCAYAPIGSPGILAFLQAAKLGQNKTATAMRPLLEEPALKPLSEKYSKTPSQILLRWLTQRGIVVIPKSATPQRIQENFQIFDFTLSPEEMKIMEGLERNLRLFSFKGPFPGVEKHPEYQF